MNNTIRMNKKHIYTAPEVEVVMLQMEAGCLNNNSTFGGSGNTTVESASYNDGDDHQGLDWN